MEEYVAMASRHFCPTCGAAHRPGDPFCALCGGLVEHPPSVAVMLLVYLACAPLAFGSTLLMMGLNGAVVPLARRALRIRTIGRAIVILDGAVAAGTFFGFAYG